MCGTLDWKVADILGGETELKGLCDRAAAKWDRRILRGEKPIDLLFEAFAHKRAPMLSLHLVPRDKRHPGNAAALKELFRVYRAVHPLMQKQTVLKDGAGVLWESDTPGELILSFRDHVRPGAFVDVATGEPATGGRLQAGRVYRTSTAQLL